MKVNILTINSFTELRTILEREVQLFAVCDANARWCLEKSGISCPSYILEACEKNKTFETAVDICRWLIENKADRKALLLSVGGGITSDLTGFVASIYKRGIRYANVPTTLLAQVDAAIGGKTGVNLDGLKNMLGCFRQSEFTCICPEALETLPRSEYLSGAAEMLKTFIIASEEDYVRAVEALSQGMDIQNLIVKAARIKAAIVEEDPYDEGRRRVLNLGHTYGHAVEWYSRGKIRHGEAVAMGIIQAARISEERGIAGNGLTDRLIRDFKACSLPTELPCPASELETALAQDKKNDSGKQRLILLKNVGETVIE